MFLVFFDKILKKHKSFFQSASKKELSRLERYIQELSDPSKPCFFSEEDLPYSKCLSKIKQLEVKLKTTIEKNKLI